MLGQIRCPALLITGDPQAGALVTSEDAATLGDVIPQAQITHIAGAGHSIRNDQFARYMDVVRGFLNATVGAP